MNGEVIMRRLAWGFVAAMIWSVAAWAAEPTAAVREAIAKASAAYADAYNSRDYAALGEWAAMRSWRRSVGGWRSIPRRGCGST
jgi:hypothetical protein